MTLVEDIYALTKSFPREEPFGLTWMFSGRFRGTKRLGYCTASDHARLQERVDRVGRMLNGLIKSRQPEGTLNQFVAFLGLL